jgi:hypothetical protein
MISAGNCLRGSLILVMLLLAGCGRLNDFQKDGVNAFIEMHPDDHYLEFKLAGIKPTPWSIVDSLAIIYYLSWDSSANLKTEIIAQMLIEKLGHKKAPGGFRKQKIQIRLTRRGPVVSGLLKGLKTSKVLSLRWSPI